MIPRRNIVFAINAGLQFTPQFLPDAPLDSAYSQTLRAFGGRPLYRFFLLSGALPYGLSLTDNGDGTATIDGTATVGGPFSFRLLLIDGERNEVTADFTINVQAAPLSLSGSIGATEVGEAFTGGVTASGGVPPYTYSLTGSVPPGLSVNAGTGAAQGTATTGGSYSFTAVVTDNNGGTASVPQSVEVEVPVVVTWEDAISALSPFIWIKSNTSEPLLNFGDGGGSVTGSAITYLQPGIMPSDPSRESFQNTTGASAISVNGIVTAFNQNVSIYFGYKGSSVTGTANIAWRTNDWFLNFYGVNVAMRIRSQNITTNYANSNILDGNPHLVGLEVGTSGVELWVDGAKVWSGTTGGTSNTSALWVYMNNTTGGQAILGNFNDFVVIRQDLTDSQHEEIYSAWAGI